MVIKLRGLSDTHFPMLEFKQAMIHKGDKKETTVSKVASLAAANSVFGSLSPAEIEAVLTLGFMRAYPKGSLIVLEGETWPYLFLIVDGKISAFKESSEGRNLMIGSFETGDLFWGLAFFHPEVGMPVNLEAREDCQVYLWERERFLPFLLNYGRISWELSRLMVSKMLVASGLVEGLAFQPVAGRVARFLLEQTSPSQTPSRRHLTLDEMAAHIGTTREMVCRYLRSFSEAGLIDITRTEYQITDREGLLGLTRQVKG